MIKLLLSLLITFIILVCSNLQAVDLYAKVPVIRASVVNIEGRCTGVIIKPKVVLTAAHCIKNDQKKVAVITYDYRIKFFTVIYKDIVTKVIDHNDLAVLYGDTGKLPNVEIAKITDPHMLDKLYIFGYGSSPTLFGAYGIYLGPITKTEGQTSWFISARIVPGDSGGPVMGTHLKKLYGLTISSFDTPTKKTFLGTITPLYHIIEVLDALGI